MEMKVMNDGSHFARIRSLDGSRAVQFLTVRANHERNRKKLSNGVVRRRRSLRDGLVSVSGDGWSCFQSLEKMCKAEKKRVKTVTAELSASGVLEDDEKISGVFEEVAGVHTVWDWFEEVSEQLLENSEEYVLFIFTLVPSMRSWLLYCAIYHILGWFVVLLWWSAGVDCNRKQRFMPSTRL
ncbi:hypothetical protein R1sor_024067 [Riccia sorocarpa]|uniref:Uncharacterized protein n=1 Tax=Riccia sorocarpa TaxID=122646 RepID=A0ABD3GQZ5_9MARC